MSKDLVVLGDSTTEVFDYIFGDNPKFHSFWATGWSARGLGNADNIEYVKSLLINIPKDSIFFLNFGTVDIDFNIRYKIKYESFVDYDGFAKEMTNGVLHLLALLVELGFKKDNVYATFIAPPVRLDYDYWLHDSLGTPPLTTRQRGMLHLGYANELKKQMKCIDLYSRLSDNFRFAGEPLGFYPALSGAYARSQPDHHQDYTKTQFAIWQEISQIEGIIPRRTESVMLLYPHYVFGIAELRDYKMPRPRTMSLSRSSECWKSIVNKYQKEDVLYGIDRVENLLIGDEFLFDFPLSYLNQKFLNRAFPYAQVVDYNFYIGQLIIKYHPKNLYIHLGLNDILFGKSNQTIMYDFDCLAIILKNNGINAKINIISVLPTIKHQGIKDKILLLNQSLREWADSRENVRFIDAYDTMLDENELPNSLYYNHLGGRLNDVGFKVLSSLINL